MKKKQNVAKQINKEVLITISLYLLYFLWWYYFAYIYPPKTVEEYEYIFGLPKWFFYSCVLGLILINILVYVVTKFFFKDIDFKEFEVDRKTEEGDIK